MNKKIFIILLNFCLNQQAATDWMYKKISHELKDFVTSGITNDMLNMTMSLDLLPLVRYKIVNRSVIVQSQTSTAPHAAVEVITKMIQSINNQIAIPNVDFIMLIGDGFRGGSSANFKNGIKYAPIFVPSKDQIYDQKNLILCPDCTYFYSRFSEFNKGIHDANKQFPFYKKISKAIWRGATTSGFHLTIQNYFNMPRYKLVYLSNLFPNYVDAKFCGLVQMNDDVLPVLKPYEGKYLSIKDQIQYKYQVLMDGNTCSFFRAYWQLFSNCLIFKEESNNVQWYYDCLRPYVHYVPIKNDCSDLIQKIQWAENNRNEVKDIIKNANKFANDNLKLSQILDYFNILFSEYSKLQN